MSPLARSAVVLFVAVLAVSTLLVVRPSPPTDSSVLREYYQQIDAERERETRAVRDAAGKCILPGVPASLAMDCVARELGKGRERPVSGRAVRWTGDRPAPPVPPKP